jgi:hypothetical protein
MFDKPIDDRLSLWAGFRASINTSDTPLEDVWDFWKSAPYIPYNNKIDPYHQQSWPSPWEIIVHNKYDDFTKAAMIAWTIKLTDRYRDSKIQIKTLVDNSQKFQYNVVTVDDQWAINYNDNGPIEAVKLPDYFYLENLIDLEPPR